MKFDELIRLVGVAPVFRTAMLLTGQESAADIRRQLDRWGRSRKIVMLRRGVYALAPLYARTALHPFVAANGMRKASYVSLQSALAYYGMIPEHTPVTTSVTTRRPEKLQTPVGRFVFRHLKPPLMFGFREQEISPGQKAVLATPEKALIDLLYLTPCSDSPAYLAELRLELPDSFDPAALIRMAERTGSRKVARAIRALQPRWTREEEYTPV